MPSRRWGWGDERSKRSERSERPEEVEEESGGWFLGAGRGGKMIAKFSKRKLIDDIEREARVLGLHRGSIDLIAERVAEKVARWAEGRAEITEEDLVRVAARELSRYNKDLSYVYKNRDKLI